MKRLFALLAIAAAPLAAHAWEVETRQNRWNVAVRVRGRTEVAPAGQGAGAQSATLRFSFSDRKSAEALLQALSDTLLATGPFKRTAKSAAGAKE